MSSKFQAREFAKFAGTAVGAFRVVQKSWILKVQSPRSPSSDRDSRDGSARVAFADITLEVMPDRSIIGRAVYETVPGSGSKLSYELPPDSSLLWATVDFNNAIPLRSPTGTWSIACDPRASVANRIALENGRTGGRYAGRDLARRSAPRWRGTGDDAGFRLYTSGVDRERRKQRGARTSPGWHVWRWPAPTGWPVAPAILSPSFDRSSGRDHEKLVSLLINHEMALRGAERNVRWARHAGTKDELARVEHDLELIRVARAARAGCAATSGSRRGSLVRADLSGRGTCQPHSPHGGSTRTQRAGPHSSGWPANLIHRCHARNRADFV